MPGGGVKAHQTQRHAEGRAIKLENPKDRVEHWPLPSAMASGRWCFVVRRARCCALVLHMELDVGALGSPEAKGASLGEILEHDGALGAGGESLLGIDLVEREVAGDSGVGRHVLAGERAGAVPDGEVAGLDKGIDVAGDGVEAKGGLVDDGLGLVAAPDERLAVGSLGADQGQGGDPRNQGGDGGDGSDELHVDSRETGHAEGLGWEMSTLSFEAVVVEQMQDD
ncbi:uncharacterized protein BJ171DRAFT_525046, partial [Polychytrium aggregatum]|uniref:uncharacterized protein n=1 Tax=Polychytrium aggregatum TaxID=110093 RepID=UPI0022FF1ECA